MGKVVTVFEVPRDTVVKAARAAIAAAREDGATVPTPLVRRLMKVARTETDFALGDWWVGSCGCLIGNLYGEHIDVEDIPDPEYPIGVKFDAELAKRLPGDGCDIYYARNGDYTARVVA